jgi:hypothetical protein
MPIRSRYTGRTTRREQPAPVQKESEPKQKNAIRRFAEWVQKNQDEYRRQTGDTTISEDIAYPVRRCVRQIGEYGEETRTDIRSRCRNYYLGDYPQESYNRQSGRKMEFVIEKSTPPQMATVKTKKPKSRQSPRVIERYIYVPAPPTRRE